MQDFLSFITELCRIISEFLLTEPIIYFTGMLIFLCVIKLVDRIIR